MRTVTAVAVACAVLAAAPGVVLNAWAQAQDVRAIRAREAQKTDERTLAYLERFRAALIAKAGPDPLLSALVFDEQEGQALVHASPSAAAEHLIWQQGAWIPSDGRQLRPWAPEADPARARFRLSAVTQAFIRERMRAHRAQSSQAADHLGGFRVGYFGKPFERLIVEMQVASMATFGLSSVQFDLATGASVDVAGAIVQAQAQRAEDDAKEKAAWAAVAHRKLVVEAPAILAQFRREIGPARLMAVYFKRDQVTFVQVDGAMIDYDKRGRFVRRPAPYDRGWLCNEGFDDGAIDWSSFPSLVERAMLAASLDEEDRDHAEVDLERPRECRPVNIEIRFANYKAPQPSVSFDASGRRKSR